MWCVFAYFVFAQVSDEESTLLSVPEDLGMLLAHCVLVGEIEVVEIIYTLFSANIYFKSASFFDWKFAPIFCYQFSECTVSFISCSKVVDFGLFTTSISIRKISQFNLQCNNLSSSLRSFVCWLGVLLLLPLHLLLLLRSHLIVIHFSTFLI